ncbi:hypothetical protein AAC387_Pa01g1917 [Persea americana]
MGYAKEDISPSRLTISRHYLFLLSPPQDTHLPSSPVRLPRPSLSPQNARNPQSGAAWGRLTPPRRCRA